MASILLVLFYCGHSTIMAFKNKDKDGDSLPSEKRAQDPHGETLREKAAKKLHGKGANPSQLGDPISVKAETSKLVPTEADEGSHKEGGREREAAANKEKRPSKI